MSTALPSLSSVLPPLVCGTATFNSQYNPDPYALPTTDIVHRALSHGVRAFDTSPYYGPAEELLGKALDTDFVRDKFPRQNYFLLTKVGRISSNDFNYSSAWMRQSIQNSLSRLRTSYLDVVYCHDVEFVSTEEVFTAVAELRKIRDESRVIKYIGISGYPVDVLCSLAEMILRRTREPLDAVMSYANFTLQNTSLELVGLPRLREAGVSVALNASLLGMGLLRHAGVPIGSQGDFHPSPIGLRNAIKEASDWCDSQNERIEDVAIRFALENWIRVGAPLGSGGELAFGIPQNREHEGDKLGVSVIGVSTIDELDKTIDVWRSILDARGHGEETALESDRDDDDHLRSLSRQKRVQDLAQQIQRIMGSWVGYTWPSPGPDFVRRTSTSVSS
jgi:aryl-alcohol dehydrogenase-like predicted oxidoreductase